MARDNLELRELGLDRSGFFRTCRLPAVERGCRRATAARRFAAWPDRPSEQGGRRTPIDIGPRAIDKPLAAPHFQTLTRAHDLPRRQQGGRVRRKIAAGDE